MQYSFKGSKVHIWQDITSEWKTLSSALQSDPLSGGLSPPVLPHPFSNLGLALSMHESLNGVVPIQADE